MLELRMLENTMFCRLRNDTSLIQQSNHELCSAHACGGYPVFFFFFFFFSSNEDEMVLWYSSAAINTDMNGVKDLVQFGCQVGCYQHRHE